MKEHVRAKRSESTADDYDGLFKLHILPAIGNLPITAVPVPLVDEATSPLAAFTRAVNFLGACGLSLPAGFSATGLPIGVQIIGAPFADATLVHIGRAFQSTTDWHLRRPAV